jgi:O-antigen/teichoic acid export membrane protein
MAFARKFLANYSILVLGDLVSRVVAFFATIRIARVLGANLFGILSFATAFTSYFELISRQGLDTYGIQEVARNPALAKKHADTILGLRLAASVLAYLALSVTVWRMTQPAELKLLVVLAGLMFFTATVSPQWVFQAVEDMKLVATARILSTLIFAILIMVLLTAPSRFFCVPIFQFCSEALTVFWLLRVFCRRYGLPRPDFDLGRWRKVLRVSLPMALEGIFGVVLFNFDTVMLGFWRPAAEVGEYSAAYKFINFASAFVFLYERNLLPVLSRCRGNPGELRRFSEKSLRFTLLLGLPLAVGGMMISQDLVNLVYGDRFAAAAKALKLLIWVIPLIGCRILFRNTLLSHGYQKQLLWATFAAAAINAALNLLLIQKYSYMGSAAAMVIAEGILLFLVSRQVARSVIPLPLLLHFWRPGLACIGLILVLDWCNSWTLLARLAVACPVYFAVAWLTRAFTAREIREALASSAPDPGNQASAIE